VRVWPTLTSAGTDTAPSMWNNTHVPVETDTGILLVGPDGHDGRLSAWDVATGTSVGPIGVLHDDVWSRKVNTTAACRIDDHPIVVAGYDDETIAILDLNARILRDELPVSGSAVRDLHLATPPGSTVVVCATTDGAICCYDLDRSRWITEKHHFYDSSFMLDTIRLDDRRIAVTSGYDASIGCLVLRLWDIDACAFVNETFTTVKVDDHDFSRYGGPVASGYIDGQPIVILMGNGSSVRVWDLRSGELIKTGFVEDGHKMMSHHISIERLCSRDVIISGGYAGALSIWNLDGTVHAIIEIGQSTSAWHVIPPDGLIVGGAKGILKLRLTPECLVSEVGDPSLYWVDNRPRRRQPPTSARSISH
jgi:WD40 repeat protein